MKNKEKYDLKELYIKWEENRMIQAWDNNKPVYTSTAQSDKILLKYFLEWLEDDYPILNDKEKEYLSAVIKPWRDKVSYVYKFKYENEERIVIQTKGLDSPICLPFFKKSTIYRGMELDKEYSLEDLGI